MKPFVYRCVYVQVCLFTGFFIYRCVHLKVCLFTGVLTRCLVSLEQKDIDGSKSTETSDALREVRKMLCFVKNTAN